MCGVVGVFEGAPGDAARLRTTIEACRDRLAHRGPDDASHWIDPAAGLALGHRRLSIIDLSPAGRQPMVSACGRYVIAFNGEIYNHGDLRRDLERAGDRFEGRSDTEVLLAAVARWGLTEALRRANGMFAGAVWDRADRRLGLFRDRFGQKPLYYGRAGRALVFGSELGALAAHPDFDGGLDRDGLELFLRHGYVPAPRTIHRLVRKLPPGTLVQFTAGDLSAGDPAPVAYWSAADAARCALASPFEGDEAEAADALDTLLRDAVRLCMIADVPLGAFLSGGIDSSTVVALMQAQSDRPVKTFSIGFHEGAYDEARHAAAVARHLGTDHTELYVTPADARRVIPRLPDLYTEPFADPSQIPTLLVSELARRHVTVSLSGDGGDEVFGGYSRHVHGSRLSSVFARLPRGVRRGAGRAVGAVPVGAWDAVASLARGGLPARLRFANPGAKAHKLAAILDAADGAEAYLRLTSLWPEPHRLVAGDPIGGTPVESPALAALRAAPTSDIVPAMMYADSVTYLPDDILVKLDRASMAVGLEARVPLLDHRVYAFAWSLPLAWKVRDGCGKRVLRRVLARYVPEALTERPKAGFAVPISDWLRGPLREWAEALLAEGRLRREGHFDPAPIRRCWAEHLSGRRDRQYRLWPVLMFQAWLERWAGRS